MSGIENMLSTIYIACSRSVQGIVKATLLRTTNLKVSFSYSRPYMGAVVNFYLQEKAKPANSTTRYYYAASFSIKLILGAM